MSNIYDAQGRHPLLLSPAFKNYIWGGNRLKRDWGKRTDMTPLAESWGTELPRGRAVRHRGGRIRGADTRGVSRRAPAGRGRKGAERRGVSAAD